MSMSGGDRQDSILVVIPAFNEERTIAEVIDGVHRNLPQADVLVVSDGSTDDTAPIARAKGAEVLELISNLGIGGAVQTGFKFALQQGYRIVIQMDGDGQHPAEALPELLETVLRDESTVAIGSRYLNGFTLPPDPWPRLAAKWLINKAINIILRIKVTDATSGFRAMNRRAIEILTGDYPQDYPEPESILTLKSHGFSIREIPVKMSPRKDGRSSISVLNGVYYLVNVLIAIFIAYFRWHFRQGKK